MSRHEISNSDDVIDSRDVIERIEELQDERQELVDALDALEDSEDNKAIDEAKSDLGTWDNSDEADELQALSALSGEADGSGDWEYGATLIRESYWQDYCEELIKDIGDLPKNIPSYIVIDWEATANNLKEYYSEVDFDGVTYLIRD
jgi:hypothetical protein